MPDLAADVRDPSRIGFANLLRLWCPYIPELTTGIQMASLCEGGVVCRMSHLVSPVALIGHQETWDQATDCRQSGCRHPGRSVGGPTWAQSELSADRTEAESAKGCYVKLPSTTLAGFSEWAAWYRALNQKPIGAGFVTEEVGPLADGRFGTNRIAYAISRARDAYLHELMITHLNAGGSVLVVFGGSHLMIYRPALDAALGPPCYVGIELERAASACR